VPDFLGTNVDLDQFYVFVETGWQTEMENPVEPGAKEDDEVGFFESCRASCADVEVMRILNHTFSHGSGEERNPSRVNELTNLLLCSSIGAPLSNDHQRSFVLSQQLNSFINLSLLRSVERRSNKGKLVDGFVNSSAEDVTGKVEEDRAGSASDGGSDCLLDMVGDIPGIGDSDAVLDVGLDEVELVNLLEGLLGGLAEVVGATDEDHGPAVGPGIGDTADGVGVSGSRDTETGSRNTGKITGVSRTIAGLLLIPTTVVVDAVALDGKAQLDDRNACII
jgi:hypothetical protein